MKKKILISSTDVMMLQFLEPHVFYLQENGYDVEVACSDVEGHIDELKAIFADKVKMHIVKLARSPLSVSNLTGFRQLLRIMRAGKYDLVWTNEPVMGVMTRLSAKLAGGRKRKILYIAHGFHFYRGAGWKRWVLFYPIEKLLSYLTDTLVTINEEDYLLAGKKFHHPKVIKIPGIGIRTQKFFQPVSAETVETTRQALGLRPGEKMLLSVGELEKRKNHATSIQAFKDAHIPDAKLFICGLGTQEQTLKELIARLELEDRVFLLGYRTDISQLCHSADVFLFTTHQEGLSVALMEAMAVGVPCIVSKIRGNVDLIEPDRGIYCDPEDVDSCTQAIRTFFCTSRDWSEAISYNREKIKAFDFSGVCRQILEQINQM